MWAGPSAGTPGALSRAALLTSGVPASCPVSQSSLVTAQSSLGAQKGLPGGPWDLQEEPLDRLSPAWPQQSQRLGQEVSVRAGPGCSPWTGLRGDRRETRWLINHESSHGSCPLLRPNGSRGLIIEQRAVVLHSDPSNPSRHHRHGKMDGNLVSRAWCSASVPLGTFSIGATDQLWRP